MDRNGLINGLRPPSDDELAQTMTHAPETPEMGFDRRLVKYATNRAMAPVNAIMGLKDLTNRAMQGEQVSEDPSAGFQALRGMSWLSGLAPRAPEGATLSAVLGPRKRIYDENALNHDLINPKTGKKVGYINMERKPDDSLYVGMAQGTHGGPWQEGFSGTKELLKSIKETYPDATGIGGFRISGARAKAGTTGPAEMSFGPKRFDPEKLAANAARMQELRRRDQEYWANASSQQPEQRAGAFDQDAAARRRDFEESHALAAIPRPPPIPQAWSQRSRRSTEEIRRLAGLPPDREDLLNRSRQLSEDVARLVRGLGNQQ